VRFVRRALCFDDHLWLSAFLSRMSDSQQVGMCVLCGLIAGLFVGPLFAPDPTGVLALVLALTVGAAVGGGLYWKGLFRPDVDSA
jgi:hypothetical protein